MITYDYKHILRLAAPLILGMVIQVLVGVTDTAFLGRVGEIELGASAIGSLIYLVVFMFSQSLGVGAQIIIARRNGEKRYSKIGHVFYQTLNIVFLFSAVCIFLIHEFSQKILTDTINSPMIQTSIMLYLFSRSWGLFFSGTKSVFRAFFIGITDTKQLLPAAIILVISNFVFDYWLIFGGIGIEPLGIEGAAIASVLAEFCAVGYLAGYLFLKVNLKKYGFNKYMFWSQSLFNEIFRLSVWIIVQNLLGWGVWLYFFVKIENLGEEALAISNILRSLSTLPFIFANALAMVEASVVSNLIGAGRDNEVIATTKRIIKFGAIPYYLSFVIMALFPVMFFRIYTNDVDIIAKATDPFYTLLVTYLIALPATIYFYAIYGTGKTKIALLFETIASVIYVITVKLMVDVYKLDLMWCWTAEFPYYVIMFLISWWYIKRNKWCCEIV